MPYKDPQKQKLAQKRHYQRNKDLYTQRGTNRKAKAHEQGDIEFFRKNSPTTPFPNPGANLRLWGTKPKVYTNLPELAETKEEQLIAAGFETPKTLGEKHLELGGSVQRRIRMACRRGEIPAIKIGQNYYIYPEDGEKWCKRARVLKALS